MWGIRIIAIVFLIGTSASSEAFALRVDQSSEAPCNLGAMYYSNSRRISEAIDPYFEAVAIYRKLAANDDTLNMELGMMLLNLGLAHDAVGQADKALADFLGGEAALKEFAKASPFGAESLVGLALVRLGDHYSNVKNFEKGEAAYKEAIDIRRKEAARAPSTRSLLHSSILYLANFYEDNGRDSEAEKLYEEALSLGRELVREEKENRPLEAVALFNLGLVKLKKKEFASAEEYLRLADSQYGELANSDARLFKPYLLDAKMHLGKAYRELGKRDKFLGCYQQALALAKQLEPDDPPTYKALTREIQSQIGSVNRKAKSR